MNIFELTRILNEAQSEIGNKLINDIEEYDAEVELHGSQEEKKVKNNFFTLVAKEIEDVNGGNQYRDALMKFIRINWIPKTSKFLKQYEEGISKVLRSIDDEDLEKLVKCISGNPIALKNKGNILSEFKNKEAVKELAYVSIGRSCGTFELLLGILMGGSKIKSVSKNIQGNQVDVAKGDINVNGIGYEVKLSGSGTLDSVHVLQLANSMNSIGSKSQTIKVWDKLSDKEKKNRLLTAFLTDKPNLIVIDDNGNYRLVTLDSFTSKRNNKESFMSNGIDISYKNVGKNAAFGNYVVSIV